MTENERAARKKKIGHILMWIVLLLLFICFIFPFLLVIINVFKTKADITANPLALIGAHGFTFKNFPEAMKKMNFWPVFASTSFPSHDFNSFSFRNSITSTYDKLPKSADNFTSNL